MVEERVCTGRVGPDPEIERLQSRIKWLREHSPKQWRTHLFHALDLASNIRHTSRVGGTVHRWAVEIEREVRGALNTDGPSAAEDNHD
jgi:hypothetical protein